MINSFYGNYRTRKFTDIWDNADSFVSDYKTNGLPAVIEDDKARTLFYLLYSKFGNSHIASSDEDRFKYSVFRIIWQYGPNWVKKLDIQSKLRDLSEEDLLAGTKQIYNKAANPSTEPGTFSDDELAYINDQTVAKSKKGKMEAYTLLISVLEDDVTESFLSKFNKLFISFVMPQKPLWYITEKGEEEND